MASKKHPQKRALNVSISRKKDSYGSIIFIVGGLFCGIFSLTILGGRTFTTPIELSKFAAFLCLISLVIPMRFYKKWLDIGKVETFMLSVFGVGPLFFSALLFVNYFIVTNTEQATYAVLLKKASIDFIPTVIFSLEGNQLEEYPEFRRFEITDENTIKATAISYQFATGLLGYKVMKNRELLMN